MIDSPAHLRASAEGLAAPLPPLTARAEQLAASVISGEHGRRRAGVGDNFWQYRPAQPHDDLRATDWRRSAQSDHRFVREKEWQTAQTVSFWADQSDAMKFASQPDIDLKSVRAALLTLATAILLQKAGEKIALLPDVPPGSGRAHLATLTLALTRSKPTPPPDVMLPAHSLAVFSSDFLSADLTPLQNTVTRAADRGVQGVLLQILDPAETNFPYSGRTIFEMPGGGMRRHEVRKAQDIRSQYLDRLAARQDDLERLARVAGWHFQSHSTQNPAMPALVRLYAALERGRA